MVPQQLGRPSVRGQGKRLLLAAARELFGQRGYAGASTRDIAQRAGITEPMLYRHFGSKANLFQQATVIPFVEFMDRYMDEYRGRPHGDLSAGEEGRRFFGGLFTALRDQRALLAALMSADISDPDLQGVDDQVCQAFGRVLRLFEEVVSSEAEVRGFTDFDLAASVRVMVGMALSLALHDRWLHVDDAGFERMLDAMTTIAVRGLGVPQPG
jgi:AcrR family transcriptional regulator